MAQIKPEVETFAKIKVIGIGGGGGNAISRMVASNIRGVEFVAVNTDAQDLHHVNVSERVHIGKNLSKGLGAGMNPEIGRQAAEENRDEIQDVIKGADMVFVTAGMGGGTGTAITEQIDESSLPAALDLIEYAKLTYDANVRIWTEFGFDPFRIDVYDDPILQEPLPYFGNESVMGVIQQNLANLGPEYLGPRYPETLQMMGEVIAYEIIEQGTDPAQVLADAADQIRALDA